MVVGGRGREEACVMRERGVSLKGVRECGCDGWEGVCDASKPSQVWCVLKCGGQVRLGRPMLPLTCSSRGSTWFKYTCASPSVCTKSPGWPRGQGNGSKGNPLMQKILMITDVMK